MYGDWFRLLFMLPSRDAEQIRKRAKGHTTYIETQMKERHTYVRKREEGYQKGTHMERGEGINHFT